MTWSVKRSKCIHRSIAIMQLRSQKRDHTTSITAKRGRNNTESSTSLQNNRVIPPSDLNAVGSNPTCCQFPVLTALKKRLKYDNKDHKILLTYPVLLPARLLRRYKRFLADVVLLDDESGKTKFETENDRSEEIRAADNVTTVYCPNTGPMVGLLEGLPNAYVQLSKSSDPKRKYAYTLEMIRIHNGERDVWVGVHSASANRMIEHALASRWLPELGHYDSVQREVKFAKNSRVDFVLTTNDKDGTVVHQKYVEVKSVTLAVDGLSKGSSRCAVFPDTVSTRAQKHVTELTDLLFATTKDQECKEKETATCQVSGTIIFLVQRDDCNEFAPSIQHDKKFAELCMVAAKSGIQLLAYACALEPDKARNCGDVRLLGPLPLHHVSL